MASVWRPVKGVSIRELDPDAQPVEKRYLFQFFHEIDMQRVIDNGPWNFENHTLVIKKVEENEEASQVELNKVAFWIQVHKLPVGFMSERIAELIGNNVGEFIKADPKNFIGLWRSYMRIRVWIDVRKSLKQKMKLRRPNSEGVWVEFKYERLGTFCFICGKLGHSERYCSRLFDAPGGQVERVYGPEMRASQRRIQNQIGEPWLVETIPVAEMGGTRFRKNQNMATAQLVPLNKESGTVNEAMNKNQGENQATDMEVNEDDSQDEGVLASDRKRQRNGIAQEEAEDSSGNVSGLNPKNGLAAGLGLQACREP